MAQDRLRKSGPFRHLPASRCNPPGGSVLAAMVAHFLTAINTIIKRYGDAALLQWLDGNHQVDRVVNLASTNYPERLDRRIVSRPRRFDRILRIDAPDADFRDAYLAHKLPEQPAAERPRWVELTEGLPFAALAELVISVACLGNDLEESVALLKSLDAQTPSSLEFADGPARDQEDQLEAPSDDRAASFCG